MCCRAQLADKKNRVYTVVAIVRTTGRYFDVAGALKLKPTTTS